MSKLFKLKEWLTVPEAAKHLSTVFGENVRESDVLRLALDRHLVLSLYLPRAIAAKSCNVYFASDVQNEVDAKDFLFSHPSGDDCYLSFWAKEIRHIQGIFDLYMLRGERLAVEAEYFGAESGKKFSLPIGNQIIVEQGGELFCLQEHSRQNILEYRAGDSEDEIQRKIAVNNYCNAIHIPDDCVFIVRTDALRNFEETINGIKTDTEKPLTQTERTTLLAIIAALCDNSKIKYQERGAAAQISRLTEASGTPVSEDAISKALKKIPGALEARMK